jgi:hypothetical protein
MSNPIDELLSRPIPEKLWHYTSIQGFHGIVTSRTVWATDLRFLNDREEFVHAQLIAKKMLGRIPERNADGYPIRELLAKAVALAFESGPLLRLQVFVASFSAAEDDLGQWRGYSLGSSGVSVGFNLRTFRPPAHIDTMVLFAPCVYKTVEKEELVLAALSHFELEVSSYWEKGFTAACEQNPEKRTQDKEKVAKEYYDANPDKMESLEAFQRLVIALRIECFQIASLLKHLAFREEEEWRLVLPVLPDEQKPMNNPPKYRDGKTGLIPYIAHPFRVKESLPIVDVILGPGSDQNSVFAAQMFLKSAGLSLTPRLSKVPYRAS